MLGMYFHIPCSDSQFVLRLYFRVCLGERSSQQLLSSTSANSRHKCPGSAVSLRERKRG